AIAQREGASFIAHGCTGKGNDQVRFDLCTTALAPDLTVIAPGREWGMTREEEIAYAKERGIPVPVDDGSPYSTDENLWGRSIECGVREDPRIEPREEVYAWTTSPAAAPDEPGNVTVHFEGGKPTSLQGKPMDFVDLIATLSELAGRQGVGRIDHVESRVVGIKSREVYECPAATVLLKAHQALEAVVLPRYVLEFQRIVASRYAGLVYGGHGSIEGVGRRSPAVVREDAGLVVHRLPAGRPKVGALRHRGEPRPRRDARRGRHPLERGGGAPRERPSRRLRRDRLGSLRLAGGSRRRSHEYRGGAHGTPRIARGEAPHRSESERPNCARRTPVRTRGDRLRAARDLGTRA